MSTHFVATFTRTASPRKLAALRKEIRAIDPTMDLCEQSIPGNTIRLFIERPADGRNSENGQIALNKKAAAVVAKALGL